MVVFARHGPVNLGDHYSQKMRTLGSYFLLFSVLVVWMPRYSVSSQHAECPDEYYESGPVTQETLVRTYFSVEYQLDGRESQCRLRYDAPLNATLYQGMRAAHQQHGDNFTYEYDTYSFGHHVTVINDVRGHESTHWALHHGDTWEAADFGVDSLFVEEDVLYLWRYTNYSHDSGGEFDPTNFTGDCHPAIIDILPAFSLTDVAVYLSVSTENTAPYAAPGTFIQPVCKRVVLTAPGTRLDHLLTEANNQLLLVFSADLAVDGQGVESVNGLANHDGYEWRTFNATSGLVLHNDLRMTTVQDGDHYELRFSAESAGSISAPTWCLSLMLLLPLFFESLL